MLFRSVQELAAFHYGCLGLLAEFELLAFEYDLIDLFDGQSLIGNCMCHYIVISSGVEKSLSDYISDQFFICDVRQGHLQARSALHLTLDRVHGALVAGPAAACNTVVHVPKEHVLDVAVKILTKKAEYKLLSVIS